MTVQGHQRTLVFLPDNVRLQIMSSLNAEPLSSLAVLADACVGEPIAEYEKGDGSHPCFPYLFHTQGL